MANFFYTASNRDQEIEDLRFALGSRQSRRLLRRLLGLCGMIERLWSENDRACAFIEGRRSIGVELAESLETAKAGSVADLMRESADERMSTITKDGV